MRDSRDGATIKTIANLFHAQISDPDPNARRDLLNIYREHNKQAQERGAGPLPQLLVRDDGAGDRFPAMKEPRAHEESDDDLGAPKGRRHRDSGHETQQFVSRMEDTVRTANGPTEVHRPTEVPQSQPPQQEQPQHFDVIRV